jgi:cysteine desulfurase
MVNNETGVIQPVQTVGELLKDHSARFHVDAVQALGKMPIDVEEIGCDLLTLSAHKIYGPKGIGCLWVRNDAYERVDDMWPYMGTPSVELAMRFGHAVQCLDVTNQHLSLKEKERWFLDVLDLVEGLDYHLNVRHTGRIPGLLSIRFPGVDAEELMFLLSEEDVMVSTGSACDRDRTPSRVLQAMGLPEEDITSTIRISLGDAVDRVQLTKAADILGKIVKELKDGS